MAEIKHEIIETIAVLSSNEKTGWAKELNLVSWNNGPVKFDIRDWAPNHSKCNKGTVLTEHEARALMGALKERFGG